MMKIKEQIITFTGSVYLKPEKLLIKQHVRTNQCLFIHSIYDLCFVYKIIIPFLKHISIIVHEKLCFQIRMGFHCTVNGCCKFIQIYLFIKFQQIRDIVDGWTHICSTFNENSLLCVGERITFLYFPLCLLACSLYKVLQHLDCRMILYIRCFHNNVKGLWDQNIQPDGCDRGQSCLINICGDSKFCITQNLCNAVK